MQELALTRGGLLSISPLNLEKPIYWYNTAPTGHIFQLTDELTQVEFGKTFGLHNFISVETENK